LHVQYVLSQPNGKLGKGFAKGHITPKMIKDFLPMGTRENFGLLCGPQGLLDDVCVPGLKAH